MCWRWRYKYRYRHVYFDQNIYLYDRLDYALRFYDHFINFIFFFIVFVLAFVNTIVDHTKYQYLVVIVIVIVNVHPHYTQHKLDKQLWHLHTSTTIY